MNDKIKDHKTHEAEKSKAAKLKEEELKKVVGGAPKGAPVGAPGQNVGPDIPNH